MISEELRDALEKECNRTILAQSPPDNTTGMAFISSIFPIIYLKKVYLDKL